MENKDIFEELQCIKTELHRYQYMTQEVLDYILKNEDNQELQEVYNIIKKWVC